MLQVLRLIIMIVGKTNVYDEQLTEVPALSKKPYKTAAFCVVFSEILCICSLLPLLRQLLFVLVVSTYSKLLTVFFSHSVLSQALSLRPPSLSPGSAPAPAPSLAAVPRSHGREWVRAPRGGTKTTPAEEEPPTYTGRIAQLPFTHSHIRVVATNPFVFFFLCRHIYKLVCSHRSRLSTV